MFIGPMSRKEICPHCGHEHACRTETDYASMLRMCRSAPPELRLIEDEPTSIYIRVRCRAAAKWLREAGIDVSERELTDYLDENFNAVPWRAPYGLVRIFRRDFKKLAPGEEPSQPRKASGDPHAGTPPAGLLEFLDVPEDARDGDGRPLRWREGGYELFSIRRLLHVARAEGRAPKFGERAVTRYLCDYYAGTVARTTKGHAVKLSESNVKFLGLEPLNVKRKTFSGSTSEESTLDN